LIDASPPALSLLQLHQTPFLRTEPHVLNNLTQQPPDLTTAPMATTDELKYETQVRAQYNNIRHAKRVLEIKSENDPTFKSTIVPYRDRWIIKSSQKLTEEDIESINKPREDAIGGRLATPASSSARARRRSAERSRVSSTTTSNDSEGQRHGGGGRAGPDNDEDPGASGPQKRVSWRTAVAKATGLKTSGKTAFQRLGVVRWGALDIHKGKIASANQQPALRMGGELRR